MNIITLCKECLASAWEHESRGSYGAVCCPSFEGHSRVVSGRSSCKCLLLEHINHCQSFQIFLLLRKWGLCSLNIIIGSTGGSKHICSDAGASGKLASE